MSRRSNAIKIQYVEPVCVECGKRGAMTSGARAYPDNPAKARAFFFVCPCGAMVSCHPGTAIPAGRPASPHTRYLRAIAHQAFDAIWAKGRRTPLASGKARNKAYKWLAAQLGMAREECHLGFMGAADLQRVIDICKQRTEAA